MTKEGDIMKPKKLMPSPSLMFMTGRVEVSSSGHQDEFEDQDCTKSLERGVTADMLRNGDMAPDGYLAKAMESGNILRTRSIFSEVE